MYKDKKVQAKEQWQLISSVSVIIPRVWIMLYSKECPYAVWSFARVFQISKLGHSLIYFLLWSQDSSQRILHFYLKGTVFLRMID